MELKREEWDSGLHINTQMGTAWSSNKVSKKMGWGRPGERLHGHTKRESHTPFALRRPPEAKEKVGRKSRRRGTNQLKEGVRHPEAGERYPDQINKGRKKRRGNSGKKSRLRKKGEGKTD